MTLFKQRYNDYKGRYGMKAAYKRVMGKEIEGTHHRGEDDAKNIATMLGMFLKAK